MNTQHSNAPRLTRGGLLAGTKFTYDGSYGVFMAGIRNTAEGVELVDIDLTSGIVFGNVSAVQHNTVEVLDN